MKILQMLWRNLRRGAVTLKFPARPKVTERYRGLVHMHPELCTGCAVCKLRCTSRAITYQAGKGEFYWSYDPGQCTFCGRCVEGCKTHAITQDAENPPIYTTQGELKQSFTIARKAPARPAAPAAKPAAAAQPAATAAAPASQPASPGGTE